ncbi:MAG: hypothetical protein ISR57_08640 [Bacteroidales bacterium]|nr:hypothetical protein [Bacteroidales bacterium]
MYYKEPDINEQKEYKYIDVRAVRTCTQNDNLYSLIKGKDKDKIGEVELNALKLIFGDPENIIRDLHPTPHGDYEWLYIKDIHIHHKYYQKGKMAWEYPNDALITLCWSCHEELHQNKDIEVKDESGNIIGFYKVCSRCHGAGWFPQYKHVENGICFKCEGSKFEDSCKI